MMRYILLVVLFQGIFLALYHLLLRKETFFSANRCYLLGSLIVSFVLPFLELPSITAQVGDAAVMLPEVVLGGSTTASLDIPPGLVQGQPAIFSWFDVYLVGLTPMLLLFLHKLFRIHQLYTSSTVATYGELFVIAIKNSAEAFTFLNAIFIGTEIPATHRDQIFAHEKVHARKKHSYDLLLLEAVKMIFWFNPLMYSYQYFLREVHEFEADALAIQPTQKVKYYEQLLQLNFGIYHISFINTFFNHSFIKKRIIMLHKSNTPTWKSVKFALLIPVIAMMVFAASCTQEESSLDKNESNAELKEEIFQLLEENQENLNDRELENIKSFINTTVDNRGTEVIEVQEVEDNQELAIPYAVVEELPSFPGCDPSASKDELKNCMSTNISNHIQKEFSQDIVNTLPKGTSTRVFVAFKIDKAGNIVDVRARARTPQLKDESIRVINLLPKMNPGKVKGSLVEVLYSVPIVLKSKK